MKSALKLATVLGLGLAMAPWAIAQAPAAQPAAPAATAATIPVDQQPTKEQLAKLFDLMRVHEQLASVTKMMPALMQQQFAAQAKQMQKDHPEIPTQTEEQQKASAKVMNKFMERAMNLYGSDEMIADMSSLYQKHLSRSDVDGIIAFYSSPSGQHMLDMMPVIMTEFMPTVMRRVQERIAPLTTEMIKEMAEANGVPAATAPKVLPPPPPPAK
jgi:hypothetical protein